MERKRKVVTSAGVQFLVDDEAIKAMDERPSVLSMGVPRGKLRLLHLWCVRREVHSHTER